MSDPASFANDGLTRSERWQFRKMAEHPDVVERVIAAATDASPPSRRKILAAIAAEEGRDGAHRCTCPDCGAVHRRRSTER
jgi:hypothetical protein